MNLQQEWVLKDYFEKLSLLHVTFPTVIDLVETYGNAADDDAEVDSGGAIDLQLSVTGRRKAAQVERFLRATFKRPRWDLVGLATAVLGARLTGELRIYTSDALVFHPFYEAATHPQLLSYQGTEEFFSVYMRTLAFEYRRLSIQTTAFHKRDHAHVRWLERNELLR